MTLHAKMVWLDLDDTLFDHSYSVGKGLERIQQEYPAFLSHPVPELVRLYNIALNEVYPDFLSGDIDFPEMRRRKFQRFCLKAGVANTDAPDTTTFHRIYDEAYNQHRRATPGSIEGVQCLKEAGFPVAVLTNGVRRGQEEKLRLIGLESLIPQLLLSEEAGAAKPDPRIFQWALEKTGMAAADVIMIGDNPINDIYGAQNAGIRAIHYDPAATTPTFSTELGEVPVMTNWSQLPELLGNFTDISQNAEVASS